MKKPKIAVLSGPEGDDSPFVEMLSRQWPGQLLFAQSSVELHRLLREFVVDIVVVDRKSTRQDGVVVWRQVASHHPALPLAVWGDAQPAEICAKRTAPVLFADSLEQLEDFISAEAVTVTRGRLTGVSLASIVQMLHSERRSCRVRARSAQLSGELYIRHGALVHATMRRFEPQFAALEMLSWTDSDVVFDRLPTTEITTIVDSLNFLLLESARLFDETQSDATRSLRQTASSTGTSTSDWVVPAVILGDAEALLNAVIRLPGARAAAIVDHESRVLVHSRLPDEQHPCGVRDALCQFLASMHDMCGSMEIGVAIDDVLVNHARGFVLLHVLPSLPSHAVVASFDRDLATLGLVRSRFVQLAQGFSAGRAIGATSQLQSQEA